MEIRKCGSSELGLSVIGLGCWAFGGGTYWGNQDQKDVNEVVQEAVDQGINYFDTAEVYNEGRSETSLGIAIRDLDRDKLIIGTKVAPSNCYPGILEQHCEDSLKRLQTDYIDLYMIHWPIHPHSVRHFTGDQNIISHPPDIREAFDAMIRLQQAGKIRHIGVSNFSMRRLKEDIPGNIHPVINELPYNLLCRAIEYDTLPYCKKAGIGIIGYITLFQGILTGRYRVLSDVPEWQRRTRHFNAAGTPLCRHGEQGFENETQSALDTIKSIAQKNGITMTEIATGWAITNKDITCALTGARNIDELKTNIDSARNPLHPELIEELNKVTEELKLKMGNHFDYYESAENDRTV